MKKIYTIAVCFSLCCIQLFGLIGAAQAINECPQHITISCEQNNGPEVTGFPLLDAGFAAPEYWDETSSDGCTTTIIRHWTSVNNLNESFACDQIITIVDNQAPVIQVPANLVFQCTDNFDSFYTIEDCSNNVDVVVIWGDLIGDSSAICPPGTFRTQTQGGWGTVPSGNNPGTYLHAHFQNAFPNGLTVGCNNTLTLTSAQDITNFLPSGSTAAPLPAGSMTNPGASYSNVLAGQIVAATLSMTFDAYDPDFGDSEEWIGDLIINDGTFQGMSMSELLQIANEVIGGCNTQYSYSEINEGLSSFNENFVDGTINLNYLECGDEPDPCALFQPYTINATDACGNASSYSGTLQLIDNSGPVFENAVAQISIDCSEWPLDYLTVTDPCGISASIIDVQETEYSGLCFPVIERIYTAADACGNISTFTQYIQRTDMQPPLAEYVPQEQHFSCDVNGYMDTPMFTDNCNNPLEVTFSEQAAGPLCNRVITRTWTATDICNNSTTVSQTIYISDTEAPVFTSIPADITLPCGSEIPADLPQATDNCSEATITFSDNWIAVEGACQQLQRTFIATDACGNSAIAIRNIYFTDTTPPVLSELPADETGDCALAANVPVITATDNCSQNVPVIYSESFDSDGCTSTVIRTWTATDDCGNSTSHSQTLTLTDNDAPQFNAPESVVISCSQIASYTIPATDNCSAVTKTYTDQIMGTGCNMQIIRTWTATDACGNSSQFVQTIQLQDNTAPVFTYVPPSYSISCGTTPVTQNAYASDNCTSGIVPVMTETTTGSGCIQVITRTWTATDNCGNTATASQTITVTDNVNPVFVGVPTNVTISCGQIPQVPVVTAYDNCAGNLPVTFTESTVGQGCDVHIVRMWSAVDFCGNDITATQHIYIDDNTAPVWTNVPASVTLGCNAAVPPVPTPVATDACSGVTNTTFFQYYESVPCGQILNRIWQATDGCGNESQITQTVSFLDNAAPVFTSVPPASVNAECGSIPAPFNVQATDGCGTTTISYSQTMISGGCPYTLRRTWIATDNCGNQASFIQNILVSDSQPPVLYNIPENVTVECGQAVPVIDVYATDNCSGNLMVSIQNLNIGSGCDYAVQRTFSATDLCGNTTSAVQIITYTDSQAPVLMNTPADIETDCENIPPPAAVTAADGCQGPLDVTFTEEVIDLDTQPVCMLDNAVSVMGEHAFWLPGLDGISIFYTFVPNTGMITFDHAAGTAQITGELQNTTNPDQRWIMQLNLINKRNWSEWSALGRSYKDDLDFAGNNYVDWSYYELDPSSSLTGAGLLAGSQLNLTHAPVNYFYGFQLGIGANNRNGAYGMSGWLDYSGIVNGVYDSGHGDLFTENTCCPEQQIIRQWSATDCSGNTVEYTQHIHVTGNVPQMAMQMPAGSMEMDVYYTSPDRFVVNIEQDTDAPVTIDYFDASGKLIGSHKKEMLQANIPLTVYIESSEMKNGLYFFRATNGKESVTRRGMRVR
jgi:hypothetical protein